MGSLDRGDQPVGYPKWCHLALVGGTLRRCSSRIYGAHTGHRAETDPEGLNPVFRPSGLNRRLRDVQDPEEQVGSDEYPEDRYYDRSRM